MTEMQPQFSSQNGRPLVTVVMPTYERPDLLRVAIDSVIGQTFDRWRIQILDNSRSDAVEQLVHSYAHGSIRYHRNEPPTKGGPHSIAAGMDLVDTPFASILCDDDRYLPEYMQKLTAPLLSDPTCDVAFCDYEVIGPDGRLLEAETEGASIRSGRSNLQPGLLANDRSSLVRLTLGRHALRLSWAAVFKTEVYRRCRSSEEFMYVDDLAASYNMAAARVQMFYVAERLSQLRIHDNTYTGTVQQRADEDSLYRWAMRREAGPDAAHLSRTLGTIQFARATARMATDPATAHHEFRKAARHSKGPKRIVAAAAGTSVAATRLTARVLGFVRS